MPGFFAAVDPVKQAQDPDYVLRRQKLLDAIWKDSLSTKPIKHWTQGAAKLVNALANKYEEGKLQEGADAANAEMWKLLGNSPSLASAAAPSLAAGVGGPAGAASAPAGPTPTIPEAVVDAEKPPNSAGSGVAMPPELAGNVYGGLGSPSPDGVSRMGFGEGIKTAMVGPAATPANMYQPSPNDPRGIRNNNPGNIEDGRFARSMPGYIGTDGRFAKFATPAAGIAAQSKLMDSYARRGISTIEGLVNRYAPASDNNNVRAYASTISNALGVAPNQPINLSDPSVKQKLLPAMIRHENGRFPYQPGTIAAGIGGGVPPTGGVQSGSPMPSGDVPAMAAGQGMRNIPIAPAAIGQVAGAPGAPMGAMPRPVMAAAPGGGSQRLIAAIAANPAMGKRLMRNPAAMLMLRQRLAQEARNTPDQVMARQQQMVLRNIQIQKLLTDLQGGTPMQRRRAALELQRIERDMREKPPATKNIKRADGSEVSVQYDWKTGKWVPLDAPQGGKSFSPKLTEGQSKDQFYYGAGATANKVLEKYGDTLASGLQAGRAGIPIIGNYTASNEYQQAKQAGARFLTAILRKESGAAITEEEEKLYGKMFLPQPGDGVAVLKQKAEARAFALEAIKAGLGNVSKIVDYVDKKTNKVKNGSSKVRVYNPKTGKIEDQ